MDFIPKLINFHDATGLASQEARIGLTGTPKGHSRESRFSGAAIGADERKHRNAHNNQEVQGARCCGKDCVCKFLTQKLLALRRVLGQHVASSGVAEENKSDQEANLKPRLLQASRCVPRKNREEVQKSTRPRQLQLTPYLIREWPVEVKI